MKDLVVNSVHYSMPSRINGPDDALRLTVTVEPRNGGTDFQLIYDAQGNFKTMVY